MSGGSGKEIAGIGHHHAQPRNADNGCPYGVLVVVGPQGGEEEQNGDNPDTLSAQVSQKIEHPVFGMSKYVCSPEKVEHTQGHRQQIASSKSKEPFWI